MANNPLGQYPVRSPGRNPTVASFQFDTANTAAPDGLVDPCGIVNGAGVRTSQGLLTFTLNDRWTVLHATCNLETTATYLAQVADVVRGLSAANTVVVTTLDEALAAQDTNNLTVNVVVVGYPSAT